MTRITIHVLKRYKKVQGDHDVHYVCASLLKYGGVNVVISSLTSRIRSYSESLPLFAILCYLILVKDRRRFLVAPLKTHVKAQHELTKGKESRRHQVTDKTKNLFSLNIHERQNIKGKTYYAYQDQREKHTNDSTIRLSVVFIVVIELH
nr:AlNc14C68G4778 [Albugo laibachii Nc14]|eukprot:CCA19336.1 AlNc14C68G4778 [Albugo laibachii Nc14]